MGLFNRKKRKTDIIKKFNGKQVSYVTRRVEADGSVRDEIVGKSGRISINDGKVSVICGTESIYESSDGSTDCNMLMSGNGATIEGNNEITGAYDKLIVNFAKFS